MQKRARLLELLRTRSFQEREVTLLQRIYKGEKLADISGATRMVETAGARGAES